MVVAPETLRKWVRFYKQRGFPGLFDKERPRGNEKGRVERAIRYVRDSFDQGRTWTSLEDLNAQADRWCVEVADRRRWVQDRTLSVGEAFAEERPRLLPLPEHDFATEDRVAVSVGKVPYVRFALNE